MPQTLLRSEGDRTRASLVPGSQTAPPLLWRGRAEDDVDAVGRLSSDFATSPAESGSAPSAAGTDQMQMDHLAVAGYK